MPPWNEWKNAGNRGVLFSFFEGLGEDLGTFASELRALVRLGWPPDLESRDLVAAIFLKTHTIETLRVREGFYLFYFLFFLIEGPLVYWSGHKVGGGLQSIGMVCEINTKIIVSLRRHVESKGRETVHPWVVWLL